MNFNQIIEALGLEKLVSTPAGGRDGSGAAGTPSPDSPRPPQQPGPPEPDEPTAEAAAGAVDEEADDGPAFDWSEEDAGDDDAEPETGEIDSGVVEEIRHELDQIGADVDANESAIRGIQSQYDEVLERLDAIEEHNTRLLGVYDRLTAGINPFAESWEARYDRARENPEETEHRYNVIEPPDGAERDPVAGSSDAEPDEPRPEDAASGNDEDAVGFEDLRDRQPATPGPDAADEAADRAESAAESPAQRRAAGARDDAYLSSLASGYASEVLLMEWLTMLVDIAGPPGTLKALDYYESIGWINRPVKHQLEDLLGGAHVPDDAPARSPGDLTTEEHNRSFAYIMKLAQQHQPNPGAHLD